MPKESSKPRELLVKISKYQTKLRWLLVPIGLLTVMCGTAPVDSSLFTAGVPLLLLLWLVFGLAYATLYTIGYIIEVKIDDKHGLTKGAEKKAEYILHSRTRVERIDKAAARAKQGFITQAQLDELDRQYKEQERISTLNRKQRYSEVVSSTIADINGTIEKFGGLAGDARFASTSMRADRVDPYIAGGMAEGLAGPAAGVAAFIDANAQNARAERELPEQRQHYAAMSLAGQLVADRYRQYLPVYQSKLEQIQRMTFLDVSPHRIGLRVLALKRRAPTMVEATVEVSVPKDAMSIERRPAIVDGSFLVTLKEGMMVAGRGHLNGRIDESCIAPSRTGFGGENGRSTHSALIKVGYIRDLSKLDVEFKFRPRDLWKATVPGGSIDIPAPPKNAVNGPA